MGKFVTASARKALSGWFGRVVLFGCLLVLLPATGWGQTASLSGSVVDADGASLPGARVTLTGDPERKAVTTPDGRFRFGELLPGAYDVIVSAEGFAAATRTANVVADEQVQLPPVMLVVSANVDVEVSLSKVDRAEVEVKAEEKQRLGGIMPNFYVAYNWNAPSLSTKQKFELAYRTVFDPATLIVNAGIAGIQQATGAMAGYGPGWGGYGKRYAADTGDVLVGTMVGGAILPALLHQDPRYFYKGTGTKKARFWYALSTAVICRGDNGKWQPNYSGIGGDVAAGLISNAYAPAESRLSPTLTIENGLIGAVADGLGNVIQEFLFKRITPKPKQP